MEIVTRAQGILSDGSAMPRSKWWAKGVLDANEGKIDPPANANDADNYQRGWDERDRLS